MKKKAIKNETNAEDGQSESITNEDSNIVQNAESNSEIPTTDNNIESINAKKTTQNQTQTSKLKIMT